MAKKSIKLDIGTVYQKKENGTYYFRYQVNGQRKAISLQTKKSKEAVAKANELIPIVKSDSTEVISAHVQYAKGLRDRVRQLELFLAWDVYAKSPDRAMPATVSEQGAYKSTWLEYVAFVDDAQVGIGDVTAPMAEGYAEHLRGTPISVSTHNRKIMRVRKVFEVLHEYREDNNPFASKSLRRKEREEQEYNVRRLSFTKEQELEIMRVLDDDKRKVKFKPEIKVIYYLGMFTGQRFKDCILLQWDRVDLKKRKIWVKQFKTGKEVVIPIADRLLEILEKAKEWQSNGYVCPNVAVRYNQTNDKGKNTGNNLVNIDALRVIKWIGLEPSVKVPHRKKKMTVYGFHSLRHSFASHCAEAGVPKAVVVSILGANSEIIDKYYTHIGEDAQLKAIEAISFDSKEKGKTDREKIEEALEFIESLAIKSEIVEKIEGVLR